jgi:hypothetical protein
MTMPLAVDIPEGVAEAWRDNLRGELDAELTGPRPAWWWTGR